MRSGPDERIHHGAPVGVRTYSVRTGPDECTIKCMVQYQHRLRSEGVLMTRDQGGKENAAWLHIGWVSNFLRSRSLPPISSLSLYCPIVHMPISCRQRFVIKPIDSPLYTLLGDVIFVNVIPGEATSIITVYMYSRVTCTYKHVPYQNGMV